MISTPHSRFVGELLNHIAKAKPFDGEISLGNGLLLKDILPIEGHEKPDQSITGFTGINIVFKSDGTTLFRVFSSKRFAGDKSPTKAFSIKSIGIAEAFYQAVLVKAEFCGFIGSINRECIVPPTPEHIVKHATEMKGTSWVENVRLGKLLS